MAPNKTKKIVANWKSSQIMGCNDVYGWTWSMQGTKLILSGTEAFQSARENEEFSWSSSQKKFGGKGTNYHNDVVLPSKRALYLKSQEPKCYINMRIKKVFQFPTYFNETVMPYLGSRLMNTWQKPVPIYVGIFSSFRSVFQSVRPIWVAFKSSWWQGCYQQWPKWMVNFWAKVKSNIFHLKLLLGNFLKIWLLFNFEPVHSASNLSLCPSLGGCNHH